jgi:hypothetical protein
MYDDYETNFFCENDFIIDEDSYYEHHHQYHSNIIRDDMYHLQDNDDDEYERDTQDYQALAYHHYA